MKPVRSGKERPDGKTDGGLPSQGSKERHEHNSAYHGNDCVLALHVSTGAFLDGCGDLFHSIITLGESQDPLSRNQPVDNRSGGADQGKDNCILFHSFNSSCVYL